MPQAPLPTDAGTGPGDTPRGRNVRPQPLAELIAAYRGTGYRVVDGDGRLAAEARVGQASPSIDALLAAHGATSGVFVTAWNPRSRAQPTAANREAHERLLRELDTGGARYLPHVGVGADPAWTEQGAFVLDIKIEEALALAEAYGQNALVAVVIGEPARLLLTRLMPS